MAEIPSGIIVLWPGSHATANALSGWSRATAFDDRFVKGRTSGNAANGGSATHNHSTSAHTHPGASHLHTGESTGTSRTGSYNLHAWNWGGANRGDTDAHIHTHTLTSSSDSYGTSGNTTSNWSTVTHDPQNYGMIAIVSDGTPEGFPDDSVVLYNSSSAPTDWTNHAGSRDLLLRMPATGDAGGGSSGSANHAHNASAHTHNAAAGNHDHSGGTVNGTYKSNTSTASGCECGWTSYVTGHSHTWDLSPAASGSANSATSASTANATYIPPYHVLLGIQNTSGADNWLEDAIVMWDGAAGSPPDDWVLCDGNNSTPNLNGKFIMFAASGGGNVGTTTSGNSGHDHTNPATHTHPQSHSHALPQTGQSPGVGSTGTTNNRPNYGTTHYHLAGTGPTNNTAYGGTAQDVSNNTDTEPEFRTVVFLKAPEEPTAGGNIGMFGANF